VSEAFAKLEFKTAPFSDTPPEDAVILSIHVNHSESSLRMHTYGCWLFVGFFVYMANGDTYDIITRTELEYKIQKGDKILKAGKQQVLSEVNFGFWSTYGGFDVNESFEEAQRLHLKQFASVFAPMLRMPL